MPPDSGMWMKWWISLWTEIFPHTLTEISCDLFEIFCDRAMNCRFKSFNVLRIVSRDILRRSFTNRDIQIAFLVAPVARYLSDSYGQPCQDAELWGQFTGCSTKKVDKALSRSVWSTVASLRLRPLSWPTTIQRLRSSIAVG